MSTHCPPNWTVLSLLPVALLLVTGCRLPGFNPPTLSILKPSSVVSVKTAEAPPDQSTFPRTASELAQPTRIRRATERMGRWSRQAAGWLGKATALVGLAFLEAAFNDWLGIDSDESEHDRLWQEGYGYNNPNAERSRQGKRW